MLLHQYCLLHMNNVYLLYKIVYNCTKFVSIMKKIYITLLCVKKTLASVFAPAHIHAVINGIIVISVVNYTSLTTLTCHN